MTPDQLHTLTLVLHVLAWPVLTFLVVALILIGVDLVRASQDARKHERMAQQDKRTREK